MFYALRNLFALVGFVAIVLAIYATVKMGPMMQTFNSFDERAIDVYTEMMNKVLETGNAAEATVWKVPVNEDLSAEDVEETMKFVANEHNIKNVGELPLSSEVEAMSGKKSRFFKIYMFCNAMTAAMMLEYSDAYLSLIHI